MYYRNNAVHPIPTTCLSLIYEEGIENVMSCSDFADEYDSYIATNCADSINKVCKYEYTKNPPYYCTTEKSAHVINVLSTAFSNAGAFRTIWVVLVVFCMGRLFPEGFEDYLKQRIHGIETVIVKKASVVQKAVAHQALNLEHGIAHQARRMTQFVHDHGTGYAHLPHADPHGQHQQQLPPPHGHAESGSTPMMVNTIIPHAEVAEPTSSNSKNLNKVHVEPFSVVQGDENV
jgi:hypothetical protein